MSREPRKRVGEFKAQRARPLRKAEIQASIKNLRELGYRVARVREDREKGFVRVKYLEEGLFGWYVRYRMYSLKPTSV